jgi:preprotein translocase subunit SecG
MVAVIGGMVMSQGDPDALMAAQAVGQVLSQLTRTLTFPFSLGAMVLLYYDRRVRTEALDVQMMAESLAAAPAPAPGQPVAGWG